MALQRSIVRAGDAARRGKILLSLLLITPLGFWLKFYDGPGQEWLNNYAAGALYEVFWCLFLFLLWPRRELAT